jgi:hypothetical protein
MLYFYEEILKIVCLADFDSDHWSQVYIMCWSDLAIGNNFCCLKEVC